MKLEIFSLKKYKSHSINFSKYIPALYQCAKWYNSALLEILCMCWMDLFCCRNNVSFILKQKKMANIKEWVNTL